MRAFTVRGRVLLAYLAAATAVAAGALVPASPVVAAPVAAGEVYAWGANWAGQLGDGGLDPSQVPVPSSAPDGIRFTAVASGDSFSIALAEDGTVYTWGVNGDGQLGTGSLGPAWRTTPGTIDAPGRTFTAVAAGGDFGMALTDDGQLLTWGQNFHGQLGRGSSGNHSPTPEVINPSGVVFEAIAGGDEHALALATDGTLYAWGHRVGLSERLASDGLVKLATFRGKNSLTTLLPRLHSDDAGLVTIYKEPKAAYIQLWPSVFDRRAPEAKLLVERELGLPYGKDSVHTVSDDLLRVLTTPTERRMVPSEQPRAERLLASNQRRERDRTQIRTSGYPLAHHASMITSWPKSASTWLDT